MTETVIFRTFPDGEVVALFPYEPGSVSDDGYSCMSFMHVGQHGAADPSIVKVTRPATWDEAAPLRRELESDPYRYELRVVSRFPANAYAARRRALKGGE